MTAEHERLVEVLNLPAAEREEQRRALRRQAVSLGEIGRIPADGERWSRSLAAAFCASLEADGEEGVLSAEEAEKAAILEKSHAARQREFLEARLSHA